MSYWWGIPIIREGPTLRPREEGMTKYQQLDTTLHDNRFKPPKPVDEKKVASNVWLHRAGEDIHVRFYRTNILTFRPNGTVTINTGGWETVSTMRRINDFVGPHIRISGYKNPTIEARQVETVTSPLHWREELVWSHGVTYNFHDGMSFDVESGALVWNPHTWEPLEYLEGMLSIPIINRLDALEQHLEEAVLGRRELTPELLDEVLRRREALEAQFESMKGKIEHETRRVQWRLETTLERTFKAFEAAADLRLKEAT